MMEKYVMVYFTHQFPILDRPFHAKANYFVWQNRYIGVEVDNVSGEEKTAIIDAEMAGKVEMKLYNGVTYNGKFAENVVFGSDNWTYDDKWSTNQQEETDYVKLWQKASYGFKYFF